MAVSAEQSLTIVSKDSAANTAIVRYIVTCTTSGESYNLNSQTGTFIVDGTSYTNSYTLPRNTTTTVFSRDITISNAAGRTVNASYSFPTTPSGGTKTGNTSVIVPSYPSVDQSVNSKTETSITMNWSSDSVIDYLWYAVNDGAWVGMSISDNTSGTYTISNLSANVSYNIKTALQKKDGHQWKSSPNLEVTTYDYPHVSNAPDFTIGDAFYITIYNPLNRHFSIWVYGDDWSTIYYGEDWTGTSVGNFAFQNIITKLYESISSTSGKYHVKVRYDNHDKDTVNAGTYYIRNITTRVKMGDSWRNGKVWVNVNGIWKPGVVWTNVNGTWRTGT